MVGLTGSDIDTGNNYTGASTGGTTAHVMETVYVIEAPSQSGAPWDSEAAWALERLRSMAETRAAWRFERATRVPRTRTPRVRRGSKNNRHFIHLS